MSWGRAYHVVFFANVSLTVLNVKIIMQLKITSREDTDVKAIQGKFFTIMFLVYFIIICHSRLLPFFLFKLYLLVGLHDGMTISRSSIFVVALGWSIHGIAAAENVICHEHSWFNVLSCTNIGADNKIKLLLILEMILYKCMTSFSHMVEMN